MKWPTLPGTLISEATICALLYDARYLGLFVHGNAKFQSEIARRYSTSASGSPPTYGLKQLGRVQIGSGGLASSRMPLLRIGATRSCASALLQRLVSEDAKRIRLLSLTDLKWQMGLHCTGSSFRPLCTVDERSMLDCSSAFEGFSMTFYAMDRRCQCTRAFRGRGTRPSFLALLFR